MMRSYPCQVVKVTDGDTVHAVVDCGFRISVRHGPDPRDRYGRWVGDIVTGPESLSVALLSTGHAKPWP